MTKITREPDTHVSSTGHAMSASSWLDTHFLAMQPEYDEMLMWVGLESGWHVLDAACGGGSFLPLMTELIGVDGKVSAIDIAPENIEIVNDRVEESNWAAPVETRVGSILELPYDDDSFNAVWCANTIQYLSDQELTRMLAEVRRVTRPGGIIGIKEFDPTALQIQPTTPTLIVHLYEALCHQGNEYFCNLLRTIDTPIWMRNSGLERIRQRPTLIVRRQPIDVHLRDVLTEFFQYCSQLAKNANLSKEEADMWNELADMGSPKHIFNDSEFLFRSIQTVFVGYVPE